MDTERLLPEVSSRSESLAVLVEVVNEMLGKSALARDGHVGARTAEVLFRLHDVGAPLQQL